MQNANILKVNDDFSAKQPQLIQAINEQKSNRLIAKKFVPWLSNKVKIVSRRYYGVRLVLGVESYIEYYHQIPKDLPKELWKKEWLTPKGELREYARMRYKGGINRKRKPYSREEMLESVQEGLADGYNPFDEIMKGVKIHETELAVVTPLHVAKSAGITLKEGIDRFLKKYPEYLDKEKTERNPTHVAHNVTRLFLTEYFADELNQPIVNITGEDLEDFLSHYEEERDWAPGAYNDRVKKLRTLFIFLKDKKLIAVDPTEDLELKKKGAKKTHAYYDAATSKTVLDLCINPDVQPMGRTIHTFLKTIYYTCTRPIKETRQLKCGDILWDRELILIDSERAKGGSGGYIALAPELAEMLRSMRVHEMPVDFYIFGKDHVPGPKPFTGSQLGWFFREKIKKPNGIAKKYTPYGMKHTRNIDLYTAGATVAQLQKLNRHASPTMTEEYLKELGLMVDHNVGKKSTRQL